VDISSEDDEFVQILLCKFEDQTKHLLPTLQRSFMIQILSSEPTIKWIDLVHRYSILVNSHFNPIPDEPVDFAKKRKRFCKNISRLSNNQIRALAQNFQVFDIDDYNLLTHFYATHSSTTSEI
jgi:hypothetical protein